MCIRISGVAEAIAEEIEGEHSGDDSDRRSQKPRLQSHCLYVLSLLEEDSPTRNRGAQPEAEKAQRGFAQDHDG